MVTDLVGFALSRTVIVADPAATRVTVTIFPAAAAVATAGLELDTMYEPEPPRIATAPVVADALRLTLDGDADNAPVFDTPASHEVPLFKMVICGRTSLPASSVNPVAMKPRES